MLSTFTPLLGHVAGIPIEETLPGVLAVGLVGARLAAAWFRRRLGRLSRDGVAGKGPVV